MKPADMETFRYCREPWRAANGSSVLTMASFRERSTHTSCEQARNVTVRKMRPVVARRAGHVAEMHLLGGGHHRVEGLTELLFQEVHVAAVRGVFGHNLAIERVRIHRQLPRRPPHVFEQPVNAPVAVLFDLVVANTADPAEARWAGRRLCPGP